MKYRAVATNIPNLSKPKQKFGNVLEPLRDWARAVLAEHHEATVKIYETREIMVEDFVGLLAPLSPSGAVSDNGEKVLPKIVKGVAV